MKHHSCLAVVGSVCYGALAFKAVTAMCMKRMHACAYERPEVPYNRVWPPRRMYAHPPACANPTALVFHPRALNAHCDAHR